jgi:PAS domain S-box-containing protein/putative nucleotidyltransferase with HDIG domain
MPGGDADKKVSEKSMPVLPTISSENALTATFALNDAGHLLSFDAEAERLFHCRAGDVLGESVRTLLPAFPQGLLCAANREASRMLRLDACPRDGSRVPVNLILTSVRFGQEAVWSGALIDLTRHHPDEERLRRSEETHRDLFERAPIGIFQTSPEGHFRRANAALARIYGYDTPEALMAQHVNAGNNLYVAPGRRAEFQQQMEHAETITDFESQVHRRDGTLLWISENARAVRDADGMLLHYEGTVQDISARKRTEAALRESEDQAQTIFDAAAVGIARVDMNGRLTRTNRAFQNMLGYTEEVLDGLACARLTHPDDSPANLQLQWDLQEGQRDGYQVEKRYCRADGSPLWANLTMTLVRDSAGRPHFSIAVVEDITARREAQQKILALNQRLEQRVQYIAALHQIDLAIMSSQDMDATLDLVLEQVRAQLGVDAAAMLICDPETENMTYAAGSGLRHSVSDYAGQAAGMIGPAGRAARQRSAVHLSNLTWTPEIFADNPLLSSEIFAAYWAVPLIAKGALKGVLEVFHRSSLPLDDGWRERLDILAGQAAIAIDSATMFQDIQRSHQELMEAYEATIEGWGRALDLRDQETEGHSRRVTDLAERLARALGLSEAELVPIRRGALLHDIGKMGVPDRILLKTDDLTPTEWRVMRRHPQDAYDMLSPIAFLRPALDIPYCHHEKWDGTGYPRGLRGEEIPLSARLFAVVDVWDALRSDRPYRAHWSEARVLDHVRALSGTHFDPRVVAVFLKMMTGKADASRAEPSESDLLPLLLAA